MKAVILYRKSSFYPDPVVCGVFLVENVEHEAYERIDTWKQNFLKRFPEFKETSFDEELAEIFQ